jgi:adenylate cyclase
VRFLLFVVLAFAAAALFYAAQVRSRSRRSDLRLDKAMRELESLQNAFARFAPHEVVERVIEGGVSLGAESKEVTILFADLKGFTPMAETLEPAVLVPLLNGYFERMGQAIESHRGHLAKFIGDGLLALFGALEPNPWQASDAMHAALAMRKALSDYNEELRRMGIPELAFGVGIHRGVVTTGVLGTSSIKEFGVIGRSVNLASRVEGLTRRYDVDILVTREVVESADPRFRTKEMPAAELKGIPGLVVTHALDAFDG